MSNTVTAYFKGRVGVAEALYQNDYGIVMAFDGIDLPAHFDCYFTVPGSDTAIPGVGADSRVAIPNAVLANSGKVVIHIPLHTGDNDSEVEYIVYFKVIGRARPEDDGTPVQMTAIERALALLQEPIGNIEEIVNEALSFTGTSFNDINNKLDNLIANSTPSQVTTLWSGTITKEGDVATLSQSIADFDFVDVYVEYYDSDYLRKPVANGSAYFAIQSQNLDDNGANNYLQLWEKGLQLSGTTATVTKNVSFRWDDFSAPPVVTPNAQTGTNIIRIDGIKLVSDTIPELNDVRYGADGVTYNNAGNAVRAQITDLKSALTSEADARIALASRVATAETDIDTLEIHKVAQPLDEHNQPTDGTDGQSLRTKGDGTTEWASVGLPTDAQTAQAVQDWLDEHPEATTTVQDGSLTEAKFSNALKLKSIKDYVTPEMFGAVGDGITDDTEAIQEAINSGAKEILFASEQYKVSIGANGYAFTLNSNIILNFNGCELLLKGNSLATYQMFYGNNIESVVFKDGNLIGDADTHQITSGTTDEWGHIIHLQGCDNVIIENMSISKAEGDGIYIVGGSTNIFISNCDVSNNGRNNISVVSCNPCYINNVNVSNATRTAPKTGIDIEPISATDICNVIISNVVGYNNGQAVIQVINSQKGIKSCIISNVVSNKRITVNNPESDSELHVEMTNLVLNGTDQVMLHLCNQSDNSNINISNVSIVNDYANSEDILFFSNLYDADIRNISLDNISIDSSNSSYPLSNSRTSANLKNCSFKGSIANVWSGYQNPHINGLKMIRTNTSAYTIDEDITAYNYQYNRFINTKASNAYVYFSESDAPDGYEIELINNGTGGFVFRCNNAQKMAMGGEVKQYVRLNPDARAVIKYNDTFGVWFVHDYFGTVYIG